MVKCPNCQIDREKISGNYRFEKQYSRGNGYYRCSWCGYVIKDNDIIEKINNEYHG